jgi:CCR4-NOT transcription complex subunit 6
MPPRRGLHTIPGAATATALQRFRVISYNILAEIYATKQAYPYCDSWSLAWPYRRGIIIQELMDSMSDVICLQEVQADSYENDLMPALSSMGYDGLFKQKTRESMGQYGKVDGCATFWKRSKFLLVENYSIEFNECVVRAATQMGLEDPDRHRFISRMSKDNIAQVLVFEVLPRNSRSRMSSNHICVVNTHLYSNHMRPEIKLWQTYTLLREIEDFVLNQELALVICGDFNSEPESAVYDYISSGSCNEDYNSLVDEVCKSLGHIDHFMHNIDLSSAMGSSFGMEPHFTNYTKLFKGTLDYIWFTPGRLKVLAVTDLPSEDDIAEHGEALPSVSYPSDHLMLCCDVALLSAGSSVRNPHTMHRGNNRGGMNQRGGMGMSGNLGNMRGQSASPGIKMGNKGPGRR